MTTLNLPEAIIELNDSPRTLPESRRTEHDYYALIDSGIGSTLEDIDPHFETMLGLVGSDDLDAQRRAIDTLRYLFANLLGKEYGPHSLAFCCLVESINGEKWTDYTPDGLLQLDKELSRLGLTTDQIYKHWLDVKKKLYIELEEAFPDHFSSGIDERETLSARMMILELQAMVDPEDPSLPERQKSLLYEYQQTIIPPVFVGKKSVLDQIRKTYVDNKIALQLEGLPVTDETSSFQFWQYVIAIEAKIKRNTPKNRRDAIESI